MPEGHGSFMQHKLISEPACPGKDDGNISVSIGLSKVFDEYFELIGMNELLNKFKTKGEPLAPLVRSMCVHSLDDCDNSMQSCADWIDNPFVREVMGLRGKQSQRTFNRALQLLGENRAAIIEKLFKGIADNFDTNDNAVAVDGSAVRRESDYGDVAGVGHPRDKNPEGMQTEFMMAVYQESKIPFYVGVFSGETSDEEQYARSLPEIIGLLDYGKLDAYAEYLEEWKSPDEREKNEQIRPFKDGVDLEELKKRTKLVRWIVHDNGGASKFNTNLICGLGHDYITRKKLNESDKVKGEDRTEWEYVEQGVWCTKTVFKDSGRVTYLFFNEALYAKKYSTAKRRFAKLLEITKKISEGKISKKELITEKYIPFLKYSTSVKVQDIITDYTEEDEEAEIKRMMGRSAGLFKLESSRELTPKEALDLYRNRVIVEHTISSLKQISGIKPVRVWRKNSVIGSMVLALLTETVLSMARYDIKPKKVTRCRKKEKEAVEARPSTKKIRESLSHLTATFVKGRKGLKTAIYSNWEPLSTEIFETIRRRGRIKPFEKGQIKPKSATAL